MRRLGLLLGLVLLLPALSGAVQLPDPGDAAVAAQQRWGSPFQGYVESGCLPSETGGPAVILPPCRAWALETAGGPKRLAGFAETTARSFSVTGLDGLVWVIGRASVATTPAGGWTCLGGQHYCWQTQPLTPPPLPPGAVWLTRITVTAGIVTAIADLRPASPDTQDVRADAPLFGVVGDGVADDSLAITRAFNNLRGQAILAQAGGLGTPQRRSNRLTFGAGKIYRCNTPIIADPPAESIVEAYGATFIATFPGPGVLFELNSIGDCSGAFVSGTAGCVNERFNMRWRGGLYGHSHATKTGTVLFKHYAARAFYLEETTTLTGTQPPNNPANMAFELNLDLSMRDTVHIHRNNWFHANTEAGGHIHIKSGRSTAQSPSYATIRDNGLSGNTGYAIYLGQNANYRSWLIDNNNFSGDATFAKIYIDSGNADANLWSDDIRITNNHMEQFETGTRMVYLDRTASAFGFKGVVISGNRINSGERSEWIGVQLTDCEGCSITGNEFTGNPIANKTAIAIAGNLSKNINICGNAFRDSSFDVYVSLVAGATRSMFSLCPPVVAPVGSKVLEGIDEAAFSTGLVAIDMSEVWADFPPVVPLAYHFALSIKDSGSLACSPLPACRVTVKKNLTASDRSGINCEVGGLANNSERQCTGVVEADANGDVLMDVKASGDNTMTIVLRIQAYYQ